MLIKGGNRFDLCIILFICFQCFGLIGGALQPVRIASILLLLVIARSCVKGKLNNYSFEFLVLLLWISYGVLTLIWTPDFDAGYKELVVIFVNFIGFFGLISLATFAKKPQESIINAWRWLFVIMLPIILIELITDWHLPLSIQGEDNLVNMGGGIIIQRKFASFTFGNLNALNTIISYIFPFLFAPFLAKKKGKNRLFSIAILLLAIYIIISNSSRAALLSAVLVSAIFIVKNLKNPKKLFAIVFLTIAGGTLLLAISPKFYEMIFLRFTQQSLSDSGRTLALDAGLQELVSSKLFGIGAGGFIQMMSKYNADITAPHNLFLEIVVQYGLLVFLLFLCFGYRIWSKTLNLVDERNKFISRVGLLVFPVIGIINSGYLLNIWLWLYLASLYILTDSQFDKRPNVY